MAKFLTYEGLEYYHGKAKAAFQAREAGKGLSANDFTDALKTKLDALPDTEVITSDEIDALFDDTEDAAEASGDGESADSNI